MTTLLVFGGGLQGMEALYLAQQAGLHTLLVDKKPCPPAKGLAGDFICTDVHCPDSSLFAWIEKAAMLLPCLEDMEAITAIEGLAKKYNRPFAFDTRAYAVTHSKKRSNALFHKLGLPMPPKADLTRPTLEGISFPLIAKPDSSSGSRGIVSLRNEQDCVRFQQDEPLWKTGYVVEEFLSGPSYSIEVLGTGSTYIPLQVTRLHMDAAYDCKGVQAPAGLPAADEKRLRDSAVRIAQALSLCGIMDVEYIVHNNIAYILEVDARLPSQTPMTVWHSTGYNMLSALLCLYGENRLLPFEPSSVQPVALSHFVVQGTEKTPCGETRLLHAEKPFYHQQNFMAACEALTDYSKGDEKYYVTCINK